MRLFVAIQFPDELKRKMAGWIQALAREIPDPERRLRWVKEDQLHLTLKFLGETSEHRLPALSQALKTSVEGQTPFSLSLAKLGHFGGRVIWLGLETGESQVAELAKVIEAACGSIGFTRETHSFHPHMTLARSKVNPKTIRIANLPPNIRDQTFGPHTVTSISLVQSNLSPRGSIYNTVALYPLMK